tara:strand:+ start:13065 stop:13256 length:192 start_codon:yes stop_codon:yes gene_type:complete
LIKDRELKNIFSYKLIMHPKRLAIIQIERHATITLSIVLSPWAKILQKIVGVGILLAYPHREA